MLMTFRNGLLLLLFSLLLSAGLHGQDDLLEEKDPCRVQLFAEIEAFVQGKPFFVGLRVEPDPGWHGYWHSPRDGGDGPAVTWKLPSGFTASKLEWPAPERMVEPGDLVVYGYPGAFLLRVLITPAAEVSAKSVRLEGTVTWQVCEKICIYGENEVALELEVAQEARPSKLGKELLEHWQAQYPIDHSKEPKLEVEQKWRPDQHRGEDGPSGGGTWIVRWWRKGEESRGPKERWKVFVHDLPAGHAHEAQVRQVRGRGDGRGAMWEASVEVEDLGVNFDPTQLGCLLVPFIGKAKGIVPAKKAITVRGIPSGRGKAKGRR